MKERQTIFIGSLCLLLLMGQETLSQTTAQTTAQKLGYDAKEKLLILHADDVGLAHSVNVATIEAMQKGMVNSASIMVPCPWFPEIAAHVRQNPTLDFGLHLTLTSEWQFLRWRYIASIDSVKGLLDKEGFMWRSVAETAAHATAAEVETELRAQIDRAIAFGIKPTHLDTHMGTLYARKDYFEVYTKLGKEYGIPVMVMRPTPELGVVNQFTPVTPAMLNQLEADGFVLLDYLVTNVPGKDYAERKKSWHDCLRNLKPGVTEIIIHLSLNDEEGKATMGETTDYGSLWRNADFRTFTDEETRALMKQLGIKLITWRELGKMAWKPKAQSGTQ
jgi:chitin disaccharide deacetylase